MSCNYAEGLSPYENKGKLGLPEVFDSEDVVNEKVDIMYAWLRDSQHAIFYTGAGISTSAGIPDFRGPKGVWTLEKKGLKPDINISWDDAKPTKSHLAIAKLVEEDKAKFVVSQNIDGLHLRSGLARSNVSELHGDMFIDSCNVCKRMVVRPSASTTVGQKCRGTGCPQKRTNGRPCRGKLCDFVLDWEAELPDPDLDLSNAHSILSDLSIVIGSTLQIIPAGTMPTLTKKYHGANGKLVIINLQPTKHDKKADLIIRTYSDRVMEKLLDKFGFAIPEYNCEKDPIVLAKTNNCLDWTQSQSDAKRVCDLAAKLEEDFKRNKKAAKIFETNSKSKTGKSSDAIKPEKDNDTSSKNRKDKNSKSGIVESKDEDIHNPKDEVKLELKDEVRIESKDEGRIESKDEVKLEFKDDSRIELKDEVKLESKAEVKTEMLNSMETTEFDQAKGKRPFEESIQSEHSFKIMKS